MTVHKYSDMENRGDQYGQNGSVPKPYWKVLVVCTMNSEMILCLSLFSENFMLHSTSYLARSRYN
jgi:hypothetical protein